MWIFLNNVSFGSGLRENKIYLVVAIFVIIVIIIAILFSNTNLISAYVPSNVLGDDWIEKHNERDQGSKFFGLESWNSFTYRNDNISYPAYLTVTTMKTIFMMDENDLIEKTKETIFKETSKQNISINRESENNGQRILKNGHKTRYIVFNGTEYFSNNYSEEIKFIGEAWNCEKSGTSIICIGFAQITSKNNSDLNLTYWADIISDKFGVFAKKYKNKAFYDDFFDINGLIYNVKCH